MLVGRHGQHFQEAVGELDQSASVIGQDEILFLAPLPLARKELFEQILPFLGGRKGGRGLRCSCHGIPLETGRYPRVKIPGQRRGRRRLRPGPGDLLEPGRLEGPDALAASSGRRCAAAPGRVLDQLQAPLGARGGRPRSRGRRPSPPSGATTVTLARSSTPMPVDGVDDVRVAVAVDDRRTARRRPRSRSRRS